MKKALFIFFLIINVILSAQSLGNYAVTRATGAGYSSISSTGSAFDRWRNISSTLNDDSRSFSEYIGFDFWYKGVRYTQFNVSTNGFLDLSTSTADGGTSANPYGYENSRFTAISGTFLALAPLYDNLLTTGTTNPLGTSLFYETSGTAPNRVLTVEWKNVTVSGNTSAILNFQVKIYETSGIIEFVYGNISPGTAAFSYSCGINSSNISAAPTISELQTQQSPNSAVFSNSPQDNLTVAPESNSLIRFTPPAPTPPSGIMSFTSVGKIAMTVNWPDWATNEIGYLVFNSTDGVNYNFITQTSANATSAAVTSLFPGTLYYWKVYAVTEGDLGTPLTGSFSTLPPGTFISVMTGNWSSGSTWDVGAVPTAGDNVLISDFHVVTIDMNASSYSLTVGQGLSGALRIGNNNIARVLTINGDITINTGASFAVNPLSDKIHTLSFIGDIINNGTFDMYGDANSVCNVTFKNSSGQTISGTGSTTEFNKVTVNLGTSSANILDVSSNNFWAPDGFLTLTNGTFKLSSSGAVSVSLFSNEGIISKSSGLWINSPNSFIKTNSHVLLYGSLTLSAGTLTVGNGPDENLISYGGNLTITGGNLNISGRLDRANTSTITNFNISGGTMTLPVVGSSSTTNAPFMMDVVGSTFNMSGGTIVLQREGGSGASDLGFTNTGGISGSVIGGVLQIGNSLTPAGSTFRINSTATIGGLTVNSANATALVFTNPLSVATNITLNAGVLNSNNLGVSLGGNWVNVAGTFLYGTGTVTFNGTAQTITKATAETFYNVVISSGTTSLGTEVTTEGSITINSGATLDVSTSNHNLNVKGNFTDNGSFFSQNGTVVFNGILASTIGGSSVTGFRNITLNNASGASLTSAKNLFGTLTLTSGVFNTSGFAFALKSNSLGTARIATITGGDIIGNITMERYLPPGATGWRFISTAVSGRTLADWNDDIITTGFTGSDYPTMAFNSVYTYDETVAGYFGYGYVGATSITNPVIPGKGYWVYIGPVPLTLDVTGPANKFAQSFSLTYTNSGFPTDDGWNMVANPYPSTIDWDAPTGWTKVNVNNAIGIWNPDLQQYANYVGGLGINGGSQYIPSSQAFWVQTNGASPSISLTEDVKSATDQAFIKMSAADFSNGLRLRISGNNYADETVVQFNSAATNGFDSQLDAGKLFSSSTKVPHLSSFWQNKEYAINSLPDLTSAVSIAIRAKAGVSGTYTISRDTILTMPKNICITLEDKLTGIKTDLTNVISYSFYLADTTKLPRFVLHFGAPLEKSGLPAICAETATASAIASGQGPGPFSYQWTDENNNIIKNVAGVYGADTLKNVLAGRYEVTVTGNEMCASLTDTITLKSPEKIQVILDVNNSTCTAASNGFSEITSVTGGVAPYSFQWFDLSTQSSVSSLPAGSYYVITKDFNQCADTSSFQIQDDNLLSASFVPDKDSIFLNIDANVTFNNTSSGNGSYLWDFGDGNTSTDISPTHQYAIPGDHQVVLISIDGACTDTAKWMISALLTTGTNDVSYNDAVSFTSSQSGDILNFHLSAQSEVRITIKDVTGKLVSEPISRKIFKEELTLPHLYLRSGIYFLTVELPSRSQTFKFTR